MQRMACPQTVVDVVGIAVDLAVGDASTGYLFEFTHDCRRTRLLVRADSCRPALYLHADRLVVVHDESVTFVGGEGFRLSHSFLTPVVEILPYRDVFLVLQECGFALLRMPEPTVSLPVMFSDLAEDCVVAGNLLVATLWDGRQETFDLRHSGYLVDPEVSDLEYEAWLRWRFEAV